MELIRIILQEIEAHRNPNTLVRISAEGYSPDQIYYHVKILHQAGFIEAIDSSHNQGMVWTPRSLTWQGHEFLDAARNEGVWQKLKAKLKDASMTLPMALIQQLLIEIAAQQVGLRKS
jgi:hypothetical protein